MPPAEAWRAVRVAPEAVDALISSTPGATQRCHLAAQREQLAATRVPGGSPEGLAAARASIDDEGGWWWYPWHRTAVRVLSRAEFAELRTSRNRHVILPEEQQALGRATVGIVGLSVGRAAAVTLALEGIGRRMKLADRDVVDLSNLNRLPVGLPALGLPKVVLAARAVAEIDPWVEVEVFDAGVTPDNLGSFLDGLDLLVEECDDLAMKLRLRTHARALRLPVLMDTSDRGLLDVERFDLTPDRPILHGRAHGRSAADVEAMSPPQQLAFVADLLGCDTVSARAAAAVIDRGTRLTGWPQTGSAVALGGALVARAARMVLLGEALPSGRYRADLGRVLAQPDLPPSDWRTADVVVAGAPSPSPSQTQTLRPEEAAGLWEAVAEVSRQVALDPVGHAYLYGQLDWAGSTGWPVGSLGLSPGGLAMLRMSARPAVAEVLRKEGGGRWIGCLWAGGLLAPTRLAWVAPGGVGGVPVDRAIAVPARVREGLAAAVRDALAPLEARLGGRRLVRLAPD